MISEIDLTAKVAELFELAGWSVQVERVVNGLALDVFVKSPAGDEIAVECKAYGQLVGMRTAREFASIVSFLRESEPNLQGWLVTTSGFTANAMETLRGHRLGGFTLDELGRKLKPIKATAPNRAETWVADLKKAQRQAKRVFVVMPFSEEMLDVFILGVRWAASELGAIAERADNLEQNGEIIDDIRRALKGCDVIVGDTTGANPNVCYEIGYAHALSRPTVLICRKGSVLPFDLQGVNHIIYDNIIGLREPLKENLRTALDLG